MSSPIHSPYPGSWHVRHSSRTLWHGKRNVHVEFTAEGSLHYTYQELETSEIKAHEEKDWEAVVDGKDGHLLSLMKETECGIEDEAGEVRADWRSRWVVVDVPSGTNSQADGVDVLCNGQTQISEVSRKEILETLESKAVIAQFPGLCELVLVAVPDDGARNEQLKNAAEQRQRERQNRSGKGAGISEGLVYDVVEEEEGSRCVVQ